MDDLIRRLPKAELHLHVEGTLEPDLMLELAARNGMSVPYGSADEARAAYEFTGLRSFLDIYYAACSVLLTERDFHDLTAAYLRRAAVDGVRHVEPFFDPQTHIARGVPFSAVVGGIVSALEEGEREHGITWKLIMCFLRDLPAESAAATLLQAMPYRDAIAGVGLDSGEVGNPPSKFAQVFRDARDAGFLAVAHAGEEGPASYVRDSLEMLGVRRIDHGVRCLEDPDLVTLLVAERVPLTVCPLSNVRLCVVDTMADHPLRRMLDAGLAVTVNSDDPAYFGGYIAENYRAVTSALGLTRGDLYRLAANAIEGSWATRERKDALVCELDGLYSE
jgi:adenosine deaminase